MLHNDINFLKRLGLQGFTETDRFVYNFRCPICKDSKKKISKKRGYAFRHKTENGLFVSCHNCGYNRSFRWFLKDTNKDLYEEYRKSTLQKSFKFVNEESKIKKKPIKTLRVLMPYKRIRELESNHEALMYLRNRKIPENTYKEIFYVEHFQKWINDNYIRNKYKSADKFTTDKRIVFPLIDSQHRIFGFQGRSIEPSNIRYLTVIPEKESYLKVWGVHNVDATKPVYVTEGIFDAVFLDNAIAMLGSDIPHKELIKMFPHKKIIFIFDNEKKNKEIIKKVKRIANNSDFGLVIWPNNLESKDINDIVLQKNIDVKKYIESLVVFGTMKKKLKLSNYLP